MGDYRCSGCQRPEVGVWPEVAPEPQPQPQPQPQPEIAPEPEPQPQPEPAVVTPPKPEVAPEPESAVVEEDEVVDLLDDPAPAPAPTKPAVIAKPNPDNLVNGGGIATGSASSHTNGYGVESVQFGNGSVVCQASGGVANRGLIPTVANFEECYGG
jgi:outer membrane biosynthesis protein TonB